MREAWTRRAATPRRGAGGHLSRRTLGLAGLFVGFTSGVRALDAPRLRSPIQLSADDIAWFRSCRSLWVEGENGAPAVYGPGMTPEGLETISGEDLAAYEARLEPILCAFFLHASFAPGRYRLGAPRDGQEEIEVMQDDVTLMRHANWRTFAIDNKRPYGDFTNYPIDMARALGIPIGKDPVRGYATIPDEEDARMVTLHRKSELVLQAYIEHAALVPGAWAIPEDGWGGIVFPRGRPVSAAAVASYRAAVGTARAISADITPRLKAQEALFGSP